MIIGAGAAGVAAGRRLRHSGLTTLVLEGRTRVGGRAHTLRAGVPTPLDLGCEWLHSANVNPVVAEAEALGFAIDRTRPDWRSHVGRGFPAEERDAFEAVSTRFWDALEQAAQNGASDRPASDLLEPGNRWNPLLEAISTYYNGVELALVSVVDLDRYTDTGINWRIADGYGTFVERAAAGLDVRFGCSVRAVDHSGAVVTVDTDRGTISARAVIVTVPTEVLAQDTIRFTPGLPGKRDAAARLPLGLADKVYLRIAPQSDVARGHVFGAPHSKNAISFDIRLRGEPVIEGYVGGEFARSLEDGGPAAFEAAARAQLGDMFGSDIQKHLSFICATAWARDPFSRGAYSHALPGYADQRAVLAAPVDGRLFFAGEACSTEFFSTAHGAWMTGRSAAEAVQAQLSR